jgi:hypothetical protein
MVYDQFTIEGDGRAAVIRVGWAFQHQQPALPALVATSPGSTRGRNRKNFCPLQCGNDISEAMTISIGFNNTGNLAVGRQRPNHAQVVANGVQVDSSDSFTAQFMPRY